MVRVLNVGEKPSVAKEVSNVLSGNRHSSEAGVSQYNRVHRFGYQLRGYGQCEMVFTSVSGHLMDHKFVDPAVKSWQGCDPSELFDTEVQKSVREGQEKVMANLQQLARQCNVLVLWLDCDREGENIASEVADVCREANPQLQVRRAKFSALTFADLTRACNTLTDIHQGESDAVDARAEIDLRSGAAFTRFQTNLLRDSINMPDGQNVISYGPCQFPTLGFIVDRWLAIKAFTPQDFWSIKCQCTDPNAASVSVDFAWQRDSGRVYDRQIGAILLSQCLNAGVGKVVKADGRRKSKCAPVPLATVEFQKRVSRWLHISSDVAMSIAEKLYQQGILSYPRTETDQFGDTYDLKALVNLQTGNPNGQLAQYASQILSQNARGMRRPRSGGNDDKAHPPIHPTKPPPPGLSGNELKVYDFVARHFLACVSHDADGEQSEVILRLAFERFRAYGSMVKERNYLDIYPWDKWANNTIPTFNVGQDVEPASLELVQSSTTAAGLLTEADLIAMMDREGIGTDATIATHIETMLKRGYATKDSSQHFHPTDLGRALLDGYDRIQHLTTDLTDPAMRAEMEADMNRISRGEKTRLAVVQEQSRILGGLFRQCQNGKSTLHQTVLAELGARAQMDVSDWRTVRREFSTCGDCDSQMALKTVTADGGRKQRALACGTCSTTHEIPSGDHKLEAIDFKCRICNFQVLKVTNTSTDKSHHVCPSCFKKPPADFGGEGEMRCFKCTHSDCKLATGTAGPGGGDAPVRKCTKCRQLSAMVLKRSPNGGYRLSCKAYPACKEVVWLPKQASAVKVTANSCARCGGQQKLLEFAFKPGTVQPGEMSDPPLKHVGCMSCDRLLQSLSGGGAVVGYSPSRGGGGGGGGAAAAAGAPGGGFNGAASFSNLAGALGGGCGRGSGNGQRQQQMQQQALGQQPMGAAAFNGGGGGSGGGGGRATAVFTKRAAPAAMQQQQPAAKRRSGPIVCKCSMPANRSQQSGRMANPRFFYMCPRQRGSGGTPCDFFQFET